MGGGFGMLVGGVIFLIFGLILAEPIITTATAAGSDDEIASFTGSKALNDLLPFVYYAVVLVAGVGMIGGGFISLRRGA